MMVMMMMTSVMVRRKMIMFEIVLWWLCSLPIKLLVVSPYVLCDLKYIEKVKNNLYHFMPFFEFHQPGSNRPSSCWRSREEVDIPILCRSPSSCLRSSSSLSSSSSSSCHHHRHYCGKIMLDRFSSLHLAQEEERYITIGKITLYWNRKE